MPSTVHPNAAVHLRRVVDGLGLDGAALLAAAGVRVFDHHGVPRIRREEFVRAKGIAARMLDDPWLGIRIGAATTVEHMDMFGAALEHATSMEEALELGSAYLAVWNEGARAWLEQHDDHHRVAWANLEQVDELADMIESQHSLIFMANAATRYVERPAELTCHLACPAPPPHRSLPELPYRLRFGASGWWIELPRDLARKPPRGAHPAVRDVIARSLEALRERLGHDGSLRGPLQVLLRERLEQAPPLAMLARELSVSTRTLQDRLQAEGTSFSRELDAARLARARELLAMPELGIKEIAARVGFSALPAFSRFFKRETGESPSAYRERTNA